MTAQLSHVLDDTPNGWMSRLGRRDVRALPNSLARWAGLAVELVRRDLVQGGLAPMLLQAGCYMLRGDQCVGVDNWVLGSAAGREFYLSQGVPPSQRPGLASGPCTLLQLLRVRK